MGNFDNVTEPMSGYDKLSMGNLVRKFAPMFNDKTFKWSVDSKKIELGDRFYWLTLPWLPVNMIPGRKCDLWLNMINHGCLDFIPRECRKCWKVVVRPKTLKQLFQLAEYQHECGYESKCGIEVRPYVRGNYGGYFYTGSYEECGDRYIEVRAEMHGIDPDMSVIMKRSCTEYEQKFGSSKDYKRPPDADHWEDLLEYYLNYNPSDGVLPPPVVTEIQQRWIDFAWERDDPTVDEFIGAKPLYPQVYTYHEQYIKEIHDA